MINNINKNIFSNYSDKDLFNLVNSKGLENFIDELRHMDISITQKQQCLHRILQRYRLNLEILDEIINYYKEDYNEAVNYLDSLINTLYKDFHQISLIYLRKGMLYYKNRDLQNAEKCLNQSLKLSETENITSKEKGHIFYYLSLVYTDWAIRTNSKEYYKQANFMYNKGKELGYKDEANKFMDNYNKNNNIKKAVAGLCLVLVLGVIIINRNHILNIFTLGKNNTTVESQVDKNKDNEENQTSTSNTDEKNAYINETEDEMDEDMIDTSDEAVFKVIEGLQENYDLAIETGDVALVHPYITKSGNLYKSYEKNIPLWHEEGIKSNMQSVEYTSVINNYNGTFRVGRASINKIEENNTIRYEKEYIDFILKIENNKLLVDSCKNYEMIDSDIYN